MIEYRANSVVQSRTQEGKIWPKAPAGIAIPVGWKLIEDSAGNLVYARDRNAQ